MKGTGDQAKGAAEAMKAKGWYHPRRCSLIWRDAGALTTDVGPRASLVNNNVCARSLSPGRSHKAHLASIRRPEMLFSTSVFILPSVGAKVLWMLNTPRWLTLIK